MPGRVLRIVTRCNRGGPLRQLEALVPGLAAHGWSGPVLVGRVASDEADGTARLRVRGAEVVRVPALGRAIDAGSDARALRAILRAVRRTRPDVVHTHMAKAGVLGRIAARLARVPAVHTFHGHHFDAPWPRGAIARAAERALAPWTAAAVALTDRQRRDVVERHRVLPADRVAVVEPGIDVEAFLAEARATSAPPANGRVHFLWAGRRVAVKDPRLLVEGVARCREPFHVWVLGEGPLGAGAMRLAEALGVADRFTWLGGLWGVAPWMASADAVVLTSRSEGAPIAAVEARVLGKPVVATAVGGVPDLVEHERHGLLVPSGDADALARALDRLAAHPDLRRRLGEAAREGAARRFGAERLARETAALYERVVAAHGGRYHRRR